MKTPFEKVTKKMLRLLYTEDFILRKRNINEALKNWGSKIASFVVYAINLKCNCPVYVKIAGL